MLTLFAIGLFAGLGWAISFNLVGYAFDSIIMKFENRDENDDHDKYA